MLKLERLAYICLITVSLLSIGILIKHSFFPPRQTYSLNLPKLVGRQLDIPGAKWSKTHVNVVVFLSTKCHFCEASMPFYRHLISERNVENSFINMVAISREPSKTVQDHLLAENVRFDQVYQLQKSNTWLRATPTFLLVDGSGVIKQALIGELNSSRQQEIFNLIRGTTPKSRAS